MALRLIQYNLLRIKYIVPSFWLGKLGMLYNILFHLNLLLHLLAQLNAEKIGTQKHRVNQLKQLNVKFSNLMKVLV